MREISRSCFAPTPFICVERTYDTVVAAFDEPGRFAFVTEALWPADSGRPSADTLCGDEASAASLPGTYLAYLAGGGQGPGARFEPLGSTWKVVGGPRLTETAADLVGPTPTLELLTFPGRTAAGGMLGAAYVSVGTATNDCEGWSNQLGVARRVVGFAHRVDRRSYLAPTGNLPCDTEVALWCLQK